MTASRSHDDFLTTQWSMVLRAGAADDAVARQALAALCQRYWYPLYAYVRRRGVAAEQAETSFRASSHVYWKSRFWLA